MKDNSKLLKEYDTQIKIYNELNEKIYILIADLIRTDSSIRVHLISKRVKDKISFEKKIKKKAYNIISDITDISAIRITCYFEDDIDRIAAIIEKEFEIDLPNTVDKRKLREDQFGYKSLHYVVMINTTRANLQEYSKLLGLKTEVQIRTILQHSWAEIEHDLGYKSEQALPFKFRRDFNRIAAILETADIEFARLKNELENYVIDLPSLFKSDLSLIPIDGPSLKYFLMNDDLLNSIETTMAKMAGISYDKTILQLEFLLAMADANGVNNILQLKNMINSYENILLSYARSIRDTKSSISAFTKGVSLFHIFQFIQSSRYED